MMKRIHLIIVGVAIAVLSVYLVGYILMLTPRWTERQAATYDGYVAQYGDIELPTSATDIRTFRWSAGLGGRAWATRFSAPLPHLQVYGRHIYSRYGCDDDEAVAPEYLPLESSPGRPDHPFGDLEWLDVDRLSGGITLPRDHAHRPFVWIDTDQDVLYAYWTD